MNCLKWSWMDQIGWGKKMIAMRCLKKFIKVRKRMDSIYIISHEILLLCETLFEIFGSCISHCRLGRGYYHEAYIMKLLHRQSVCGWTLQQQSHRCIAKSSTIEVTCEASNMYDIPLVVVSFGFSWFFSPFLQPSIGWKWWKRWLYTFHM